MARRLNHRLIKSLRSYEIGELAMLLSCHKNTVRNWIKDGLPTLCDGRRPILVHGSDARDYLERKRAGRRHKCRPDEMFCFGCRQPRQPALKMVDFKPTSTTGGLLAGICEQCSTLMFKRASRASLGRVSGLLEVKFMEADESLNGRPAAPLNCDSDKER